MTNNISNKTIMAHLANKLATLNDNPKNIAQGFTTGIAISFTPFVGFHLLLSWLIAKLFHQNQAAAALGTVVGNPWTFPFIWYATFHLGNFILASEQSPSDTDFITVFKELFHAVVLLDFHRFITDVWPVFWPMLIGCIPFCTVLWLLLPIIITKALVKERKR